jgi:hypothetical protein
LIGYKNEYEGKALLGIFSFLVFARRSTRKQPNLLASQFQTMSVQSKKKKEFNYYF